jgi:hypothetical protein
LCLFGKKSLKARVKKKVFPAAQEPCTFIPSLTQMKIAQNEKETRFVAHEAPFFRKGF